jgi:hypothetical protein
MIVTPSINATIALGWVISSEGDGRVRFAIGVLSFA